MTKINARHSPHSALGQKYLASGKNMAMRLWENEPPNDDKPPVRRDSETVGQVISGMAELTLKGPTAQGHGRDEKDV